MKTILLMAEETDQFFWIPNTQENGYLPEQEIVEVEDLDLDEHTIKQLRNWNSQYGYIITPEQKETFNFVGKLLYSKVKEKLKGKYHVVYYDEILNEVVEN